MLLQEDKVKCLDNRVLAACDKMVAHRQIAEVKLDVFSFYQKEKFLMK